MKNRKEADASEVGRLSCFRLNPKAQRSSNIWRAVKLSLIPNPKATLSLRA